MRLADTSLQAFECKVSLTHRDTVPPVQRQNNASTLPRPMCGSTGSNGKMESAPANSIHCHCYILLVIQYHLLSLDFDTETFRMHLQKSNISTGLSIFVVVAKIRAVVSQYDTICILESF